MENNRIPFPHILTIPVTSNNNLFRFVTDENIVESGRVVDFDRTQENPKTKMPEKTFFVFRLDSVNEKRKARGLWQNWPRWPIYYRVTGAYLGRQFQSELGTENFIK